MKTKNKILLSVGVLCAVALIAVVAIVAVFASQTQTVTSAINVTYTIEDVSGTVQAWFGKGAEATTSIGDVVTFGPGDDQKTETRNPDNIELTAKLDYVIFKYEFKADTEENYTAKLQFTGNEGNKNVTVKVLQGETATATGITATDFEDGEAQDVEATNWNTATAKDFGTQITVQKDKPQYFYVLVKIEDKKLAAAFKGTFSWALAAAEAV